MKKTGKMIKDNNVLRYLCQRIFSIGQGVKKWDF